MDKKTKLICIGFAFEHHKGTHAGYNHVKDYAGYDEYIDCQKYFEKLTHASSNFFARCYRRAMRLIFGYPFFPVFLFKMILLSFKGKCIFHIIYGENLYTPRMQHLFNGSKVVCTFHQPFSWFDNETWKNYLKGIDGIILLSDKELKLFQQITQKDNITYIPHGVFTDYYSPDKSCTKTNMMLTVGNWLRDYELADRVYSDFLQKHPDWQITIVANKECTKSVHQDDRIHCLTGISDDELRELYRKCKILFLPLKRYTANNALLEAASCGCNIIISSNNEDNSYIPSGFINTVPMEKDIVLTQIEENITHPSDSKMLVDYVNQHYSWKTIGQKVHSYLLSYSK